MNILYTAEALATGDGRNGHVTSQDGRINLDLAIPKEMGGSGEGANPEQLFAAGYSACFHSALQSAAREAKVKITGSSVGAQVNIGPLDGGGFGLSVALEVVIPDVPHDQAQAIADRAHQICPYSNATRGNIEVTVVVVED